MTSLLPFDEQLCLRLTMTLLHFVWQGAAIALAAVLATLALRRAAPNLRYGALLMSLLMMAACPPLTFLLMPAAAEAPAASSAYEPADPGMQFPPGQLRPEADGPEALAKPAGRVAPKVIGRAAGLLAHLSAPEHWRAWSRYVVAAYVAGVLLAFGRLSLGICGGTRLRRVSEPVLDRDLLASLAKQARALGLRFTPAIAWCGRVAVPTVIGALQPIVLLPLAVASGLSTRQVEVLLAHELAHIRRYDHLINLLQRVIEVFLFFHPAVWFVSGRIRVERELCCDDLVVAAGHTPLIYADSLVSLAEICRLHRSPHGLPAAAVLGAAGSPTQLRERIRRLIGETGHSTMRLTRAWGLVLIIAVALPFCLKLHATAQPSPAASPAPEAAAAEGQAKLKWEKFPTEFADYYCIQGVPTAPLDPKPAFCKSDQPILADAKHTPFATTMVMDESGGTGSGYDTLYVDFNRDGNYADDPVYKAEPFKGELGPDRGIVRAYWPDVVMPRANVPNAKPHVQMFLGRRNCTLIPRDWAVGTLTLGGRTMPAALIDANWNNDVSNLGGYTPGQSPDRAPNGDYLILGIDGEKELKPPTNLFIPGEGGSARGFLTKHLVLDNGTFELKAAQLSGGAKLELAPAQLPTGTVKFAQRPETSHLLMMGQSTCVLRSGNPTELAVPDDTYLLMNRGYSDNVFAVKKGEQTEVDPRPEGRPQVVVAPPPASQASTPLARLLSGNWTSLDEWTRYVQQFIATYKLDRTQQEAAFSILKDLRGRRQEYWTTHKGDYEAAANIDDNARRAAQLQALDKPINDMFTELQTRLMAIPTEKQLKAVVSAQPTRPRAGTQPARR